MKLKLTEAQVRKVANKIYKKHQKPRQTILLSRSELNNIHAFVEEHEADSFLIELIDDNGIGIAVHILTEDQIHREDCTDYGNW